jgi:site-specific DNA-methyltransferase (adenine-specific)
MNNLQNKDCLELLKEIPDNSIDLVLTDPPYYIGFDGGKGWDSQWKTAEEYLKWCEDWTRECVRVLKDNRMLIVFGTLKTDTFLKYKLDVLNNMKDMHSQNEIIWSYNWGGRSKDNFARKHEYAWCYSKGEEFLFNGDDVRVERKQKINIRTGLPHTQGTIPTCVWEKNNHTTSKEYCSWHPTQKPIEILSRMILGYTNKEDTVLDIFSGSGSTMISCALTGRNFIGSELDADYFEKSKERFEELTKTE